MRLGVADLEAQVGGHEIGQPARILDVVEHHEDVRREDLAERDDLLELLAHGAHEGFGLGVDAGATVSGSRSILHSKNGWVWVNFSILALHRPWVRILMRPSGSLRMRMIMATVPVL